MAVTRIDTLRPEAAFLFLPNETAPSRNCPLIRSRVIFRLILPSDEKVNVLVLEGHDAVELSAQRNRGDTMFFPIIDILGIADFRAPLLVEGVGEYRLEVRLGQSIAQEVLVEQAVSPFSVSDYRRYGRTRSHRAKAAAGLCVELHGNAHPKIPPASLGKDQVKNLRLR